MIVNQAQVLASILLHYSDTTTVEGEIEERPMGETNHDKFYGGDLLCFLLALAATR